MNVIQSTTPLLTIDMAIERSEFSPRAGYTADRLPDFGFTPHMAREMPNAAIVPSAERNGIIGAGEPLRPCPLCGAVAYLQKLFSGIVTVGIMDHSIHCANEECGCSVRGLSESDVVALWNERIADAQITALDSRLNAVEQRADHLLNTINDWLDSARDSEAALNKMIASAGKDVLRECLTLQRNIVRDLVASMAAGMEGVAT